MPYFFYKLIPPRATFGFDMNEQERTVMNDHIAYFNLLFNKGIAVLFGPVMDAKGAWGLSVLETETEEAALEIAQNDPSVKAGINTFELFPILSNKVRAK